MGIDRSGTIPYTVCTSGTRPSTPAEGQMIYETDTDRMYYYSGSAWVTNTQPGSIVQVVYARSDSRTTYSSLTTGNGTTVSALNLTITPIYSTSYIWCEWMINGELHQDNVFVIQKGGTLQTSPAGYNTESGNSRWSGMMSAFYDQNESSTPSNWKLNYMDTNLGGTSARTYAPAVRASGGTAYTLYLNRTVASTGQDAYETMVSMGIAMEIRQ